MPKTFEVVKLDLQSRKKRRERGPVAAWVMEISGRKK
jgi:hypothetical protein